MGEAGLLRRDSEEETGAPRHLMTPEGLRAALARPDPEESN